MERQVHFSQSSTDPKLCVVAIMKNEASSILEWVAYYRVMGAARIIIYDNDSTDGTTALLAALADSGFVTHVPWPSLDHESPQCAAYADAVTRVAGDMDWVMFVDTDEFMVPITNDNIPAAIARISAGDDDISAIGANWLTFGTSGLTKRDSRLVTEKFTQCARSDMTPNQCIKSIVRPDRIREPHIHHCHLKSGRYVDDRGRDLEIVHNGLSKAISHLNLQVNHYMTKTEEDWQIKYSRGNANRSINSSDKYTRINEDLFKTANRNETQNDALNRFMTPLKAEILHIQNEISSDLRRFQPSFDL